MKILCIGAHYDDIELNCAGTLMKAHDQDAELFIVVCTDGAKGGDPAVRLAEQKEVDRIIGFTKTWYLGFEDSKLQHGYDLVDKIEGVIKRLKPDYIFTHFEGDFHQDHIAVAKSVKSANRNASASLITFPSQDIKLPFHSNLYVDITDYFDTKLKIIDVYNSQKEKPWFDKDLIIARNIGTQVAKYVERFYIEFLKL